MNVQPRFVALKSLSVNTHLVQNGGVPGNARAGDATPDENARILGIAIVPAEYKFVQQARAREGGLEIQR